MTGQGSSPHPAVALSDACGTPAQGPQGGQWWGEAVLAAGREQGAGLGGRRRLGALHGRGAPLSGPEQEPKVCYGGRW